MTVNFSRHSVANISKGPDFMVCGSIQFFKCPFLLRSKKTINQTLETVTLVVIIVTFNFNSGANVSRGPSVNSTF